MKRKSFYVFSERDYIITAPDLVEKKRKYESNLFHDLIKCLNEMSDKLVTGVEKLYLFRSGPEKETLLISIALSPKPEVHGWGRSMSKKEWRIISAWMNGYERSLDHRANGESNVSVSYDGNKIY